MQKSYLFLRVIIFALFVSIFFITADVFGRDCEKLAQDVREYQSFRKEKDRKLDWLKEGMRKANAEFKRADQEYGRNPSKLNYAKMKKARDEYEFRKSDYKKSWQRYSQILDREGRLLKKLRDCQRAR